MLYIMFFALGIVLGSFYNVVVLRVPIGKPVHKGRSMCPKCSNTLGFLDLFPVFSWIFLRGKCRYCKVKVSYRYPLIELITGVLFLFTYHHFGFTYSLIIYLPFYSMLLMTVIMDFEHMIISLGLLIISSVLSFVGLILADADILDSVLGLVVGGAIYFVIYISAKFVFKKEAFGEGDVYLLAAIGLVLGLRGTLFTSILSFYTAIIFIVIFKILGKRIKFAQEIAFGPYICLTAFLVSLFENEIYDIYRMVIL